MSAPRCRLRPVRTITQRSPGSHLPISESSSAARRETYLWPATHWHALPHLGRIHYLKALPELPLHRHENAYEICLLRQGSLTWELGRRPLPLVSGDVLVIGPAAEHGGCWSMMQPCQLDFLQLHAGLREQAFRPLLQKLSALVGKPMPAGSAVAGAFDRILAEARHSDSLSSLTMQAAVVDLLAAIIRLPGSIMTPFSEPVMRVVHQLESQPGEWPTIPALARIAGLGSTQLQIRFRRETGSSINAFAQAQRLRHAKHLLGRGRSCTSVAMSLGFSSSQYFATVFKRHFGISPHQIRRS